MKKLIVTAAFLFAAFALSLFMQAGSTAYAADVKLTTPEGIVLTQSGGNYAIVWGQVVGNVGYTVEIDGEEQTTATNVNTYNANSLLSGIVHKVRVKALSEGGTADSDYSALTDIVIRKKLPQPTGVVVSNLVLSWNAVERAVGYKVTVNGVVVEENATATQCDLSAKLYCTGGYDVKIKALGDNDLCFDSDYSVVYTYNHVKTLTVPKNLAIATSGGVVTASWDGVEYAGSYEVCADGNTYSTANCSIDLTDVFAAVGDHTVKVKAKGSGNFLDSPYTEAAAYSAVAEISAPSLTLTGDTVSWENPVGAKGYSVLIENVGGEIYKNTEFTANSLDMAALTLNQPAGEYRVSVQALKNGNYYASDISYVSYKKYVKLAAPVLTLTGTTVSWGAVENAADYTVSVDGRLRNGNLDATSYDFSADVSEVKTYTVSVTANGKGWYISSDSAVTQYVFAGKLSKTDVTAQGTVVTWSPVLGAESYAVTVDGSVVATGVTATSYDVGNFCTENKEYVVGVYAEKCGNYAAADSATVSVTGAALAQADNQEQNKTYVVHSGVDLSQYILFVDGVKSAETFSYVDSVGRVNLPSSAQKLIIVPDADNLTDSSWYFTEMDLASGVYSEDLQGYSLSPSCATSKVADDLQTADEEGYAAVTMEGYTVYYHVKKNGYCPKAA